MIEAITFAEENSKSYIYRHNHHEKKIRKNRFARGGYDTETVDDGLANPQLVKNLTNKTFTFAPDKINVLFGPNASGKSTIIKALAQYCMCGSGSGYDGMTNFKKFEPFDYPFATRISETRPYTEEGIGDVIAAKAGNKAFVEWDGNPVYCHNFSGNNINCFEDLEGTIVDEGNCSSLQYIMGKDKVSYGQHSLFLLNQVMKRIESMTKIDNFVGEMQGKLEKLKINNTWEECYKNNFKYIEKHFKEKSIPTVLFDEIDKSLDIINTVKLYRNFLPGVIKKLNCQIILVTHSPFVLLNEKKVKDNYNIISLDEEYTQNVREKLASLKF